jgi:RHS repeat-associated protein
MTEIHDVLYPSKDNDTRVSHRCYDAKERLIAWSVRQGDHFLLFGVDAFREATLANGDKLDVPETIQCRFSEEDIAPSAAFANESSVSYEYDPYGNTDTGSDNALPDLYTWAGYEPEAETHLQYARACCYEPTQGRWLDDEPLGHEAGDAHFHPYIQ